VKNLLDAAMARANCDAVTALRLSSEILGARGVVYPATEVAVRVQQRPCDRGVEAVAVSLLPRSPAPAPGVLRKIRRADLLVFGPGRIAQDLLSILLVTGVAEAVRAASGLKVLLSNLMTQPAEARGIGTEDHLDLLGTHVGRFIDCVLLSNTVLPPAAVEAAARKGRFPLLGDHRAILARGAVPIERAMLNLGNARIRHDPRKVAGALVQLGEASRQAIGHRA
jgi:uncharacterized cofD-like protein